MRHVALLLTSIVILASRVIAQQAPPEEQSARSWLSESAWYFGYPGGMVFHTAFHGPYTTRFLLLKSAAHSVEFCDYLELSKEQQLLIQDLNPVPLGKEIPRSNFDPNDEPDEQVLKADYFAFLSESQLVKLDLVAFRFDGFAAMTRKSLAQHLDISESSQAKIRVVVGDIREKVFLPRFCWEFAAPLPVDIKFRDCQFAGSICTHLNLKVLEILTDEECQRVRKFISTLNGNDVIEHIEEVAPLPGGISALMQFTATSPAKTKLSDAPER